MEERMSRWGVGPVFALLSLAYGFGALLISRFFYPVSRIDLIPYWLLCVLGIALLAIGLPFFVLSVMTVMRAYNANALVTSGVFTCCRHPLYAAWVVFIVPGIALLAGSWIALTTPLFMYVVLSILVKKEDAYLEKAFGSPYLEYKKRVPCIVPVGRFKSSL